MTPMATPVGTYGERARQPCHRSFFRDRLAAAAERSGLYGDFEPARRVHEYLIDQANLRGHWGAFSRRGPVGAPDAELCLEEIVVGLLQPHAPWEGRVVKLVVRILQSGEIEPARLVFGARREYALSNLKWLVDRIPAPERTDDVERVASALHARPPRAPRPPSVRYDPSRLLRRPATARRLRRTTGP